MKGKGETLPPVHEWGLRPAFNAHVKLLVRLINRLSPVSQLFRNTHVLHGVNPIRGVHVVGVLVRSDVKIRSSGACVLLGLSDGTGIVDCTVRSNSGTGMVRPCFEVAQKLQLGDAIAVYGELYTSLERREIAVAKLRVLFDPNELLLHYLEVIELDATVYREPFAVDMAVNEDAMCEAMRDCHATCVCDATYSSSLGYCCCQASAMAEGDKQFLHALLLRLHALEAGKPGLGPVYFTFQELIDDATLSEANDAINAQLVAPVVPNCYPMTKVQRLRSALFRIRNDRLVWLVDREGDVWILGSRRRWLQPLVQSVLAEHNLQVSWDRRVIEEVQKIHSWVSGGRVRACLGEMQRERQQAQRTQRCNSKV